MAQETVAQAIQNLRRALDEGEHTCSMQLEPIGDMTEVAFYLDGVDILSVLDKGQLALETTSSSSPGVFKPTDSDDYVHVVMPMFVQW